MYNVIVTLVDGTTYTLVPGSLNKDQALDAMKELVDTQIIPLDASGTMFAPLTQLKRVFISGTV